MQGDNKNIYDDDGMSLNTRQTPYVPDNNKASYNGNADMTVPQKAQMPANSDQDNSEKAGLFDGISKAQVLAGALASVTSMLLSSKIGIAGSVIGVAVGSVVSTVASTVYKNILNNSANALKNASVFGGNDHNESDSEQTHITGYNDTALDKTVIDTPLKSYLNSQDETVSASNDIDVDNNGSTLRVAPDELIEKNAERHKKQIRNRMIIFSVVASLIAVAITAILINAFTGGEGIGQKTDPIILPSSSVSSNKADPTDADKTDSTMAPSKKQQNDDSDDKLSGKKSIDEQSKDVSGSVNSDSSSSTNGKSNETDISSSSDKSSTGQSDSSSSSAGNSNTNNSSSNSNANSSKPSSDSNLAGSGNQSGSNTQQPSTPSQDSSASADSSSSTVSGNGTTSIFN